jgi:hypothetical protein
MPEIWLPVVGYDGHYSVSDHGRVRSEPRTLMRPNGSWVRHRGKILTQTPHYKSGHRSVTLRWDGKPRTESVHRLVLEAFIGPCPEGMECCHWDDDPSNNHLSNLRWGTRSDNKYDLVRNGRHPQARLTQCRHGHELTPENTYVYGHERQCKTCTFARTAARRRQLKAAS